MKHETEKFQNVLRSTQIEGHLHKRNSAAFCWLVSFDCATMDKTKSKREPHKNLTKRSGTS